MFLLQVQGTKSFVACVVDMSPDYHTFDAMVALLGVTYSYMSCAQCQAAIGGCGCITQGAGGLG